jgi:hypothetical protein
MQKAVLRINTRLPAIPSWLKIDNSITFPLPLKKAKELAAKLMEVQDDIDVEFNFTGGKDALVEIKFEGKKEPEN